MIIEDEKLTPEEDYRLSYCAKCPNGEGFKAFKETGVVECRHPRPGAKVFSTIRWHFPKTIEECKWNHVMYKREFGRVDRYISIKPDKILTEIVAKIGDDYEDEELLGYCTDEPKDVLRKLWTTHSIAIYRARPLDDVGLGIHSLGDRIETRIPPGTRVLASLDELMREYKPRIKEQWGNDFDSFKYNKKTRRVTKDMVRRQIMNGLINTAYKILLEKLRSSKRSFADDVHEEVDIEIETLRSEYAEGNYRRIFLYILKDKMSVEICEAVLGKDNPTIEDLEAHFRSEVEDIPFKKSHP